MSPTKTKTVTTVDEAQALLDELRAEEARLTNELHQALAGADGDRAVAVARRRDEMPLRVRAASIGLVLAQAADAEREASTYDFEIARLTGVAAEAEERYATAANTVGMHQASGHELILIEARAQVADVSRIRDQHVQRAATLRRQAGGMAQVDARREAAPIVRSLPHARGAA